MSTTEQSSVLTGFSPDELNTVAQRALARAKSGQAEVTIAAYTRDLTRFANNQIHQNVSEKDFKLTVRVAVGQKVGQAVTNDLSDEAIARAVANAEELASHQPANADFAGFAPAQVILPVEAAHQRTLAFAPGDRAGVVGHVCRDSLRAGLTAAGSFATALEQRAIANSNGLFAFHQQTIADFNTVVMSEDSSGWAAAASLDASEIDGEALAREAIDKAQRSRKPQSLDPGVYTVILEEYAVLDLLQNLASCFGAEGVREGRSFMSGRAGELLLHPEISIWDDGRDLTGIPSTFDDEGTPKQRVELITRGRVGTPIYDRHTAHLEGKTSTGHYSNGAAFWGPGQEASNLFMAPGQHTLDEMLASTEHGIWVTRFHYTNMSDARNTTLTGMTRDGTFLVKDGQLTTPLRNLRFTHSILEALRDVVMLGKHTKLELNYFGGGNRAPALKIENFRFTGKTNF